MNSIEWLVFILLIQIIHFLSTWKLYRKANKKAWEALLPFYNAFVLMKIINRPKWWVILLLIPIINLILFPIVWIETIRSFGKNSKMDSWMVVLTLGFYITYLNYNSKNLEYIHDRSLKPTSKTGEWMSSIAYAVIAATLVHTYIMQPFTIPSSSLEKTLLIGDFLFVSKFHYGARVPMTTIAAPMVHDTLPILKTKSYVFSDNYDKRESSFLNKFQLPYFRLPGFQKIQRNEIVVFNQPADTLLDMNNFRPKRNYYKPIDKKTNLVKRCVAIAGDSLEIKAGYVYINGKKTKLPERAKPQYNFFIDTNGKSINQNSLKHKYGAREGASYPNGNFGITKDGGYVLTLTDNESKKIAKNKNVRKVTKMLSEKGNKSDVFPHDSKLNWNMDYYGPIYIPEKGKTVQLNKSSIPFYKRIIQEYESNSLVIKDDKIIINGIETESYTFKQNYYWMMGDNRQNSLDSRAWGFVPFDHVIGKPVFIWFSINDQTESMLEKIRWNRLFTTVKGEGKPTSYLIYFFAILSIYQVFRYYYKRKKLSRNNED